MSQIPPANICIERKILGERLRNIDIRQNYKIKKLNEWTKMKIRIEHLIDQQIHKRKHWEDKVLEADKAECGLDKDRKQELIFWNKFSSNVL